MSYKHEVMFTSFPGGVPPASYTDLIDRIKADAGITTATLEGKGWGPKEYGTSIELTFDTEPTAGEKALIDGHVGASPSSSAGEHWSISKSDSFELISTTGDPGVEEVALRVTRDSGSVSLLETWEDWDYHFKDLKQVRRLDLRSSFSPRMSIKHHSGPAGERFWHVGVDTNTVFRIGTADDSNEFDNLALDFTRTGTTVDNCTIYCPLTVQGELTASTPTAGTSVATKSYVDALVQGVEWQDSVISVLDDPPGSPASGLRHLVGTGTGAWAGMDNHIAEGNGASWDFTAPVQGMTLPIDSPRSYKNYNGSAWVELGSAISHANLITGADEHPEYVLADGTRAFSSSLTTPGATCTADLNIDSALPRVQFYDTDGPVDERRFRFYAASGLLACAHVTDDFGTTTAIQTWRKSSGSGDTLCDITATTTTVTGDVVVNGNISFTQHKHVQTFTMQGPVTLNQLASQNFRFPFAATITEIIATANEAVATGAFTFRVRCGDHISYSDPADNVGTVSLDDTTNTVTNSTTGLVYAVAEGDVARVDCTLSGTQTSSDGESNVMVQIVYTRAN